MKGKANITINKDLSKQEEMNAISASFRDRFNDDSNDVVASGSTNYWVQDTYDTYLIVESSKDGDYFKVPYSVSGNDYIFASQSDWVEVERKYVETVSKKELIVHKGCAKKNYGDSVIKTEEDEEED